ncbi:MAG: cytidylate kinase-like family protein [Treponema sp.]|nr:cytidylate kinase-like family protein [Treponema sp.]
MAVIAISRQVAALGDEIAAATAKKLGYKFITRQEIEKRIVDLGFPADKLKKYDERKPGFFASLAKDRDEYMDYLQTAVLEAAAEGDCILIGRGAFIILGELPNLFSVRLVSKDDVRMERLKKEFSWNDKQAKQRIEESDSNRLGFHKSFFNHQNEESTNFDMVLNSGVFNEEAASNMIVEAVKNIITPEKEEGGKLKVRDLLLAQNLVNTLIFKHKININFLHAVVTGNKIVLQGVADSNAIVEKALILSSKELPEYQFESTISVVQDFKTYP